MNHSYGTPELTTPEPSDPNHLLEIDEADIRLLSPYEGESDSQTLVGLGPVSRYLALEKAEIRPCPQEQPASQPPGPWGSDDEPVPASLRGKKLGTWGVAVPLLLVVAGVAVVFVRALGASGARPPERAPSVAPPERDDASLAVELSGADVRVFIDGQDRGRPPLVLNELAPGSHSVAILGPAYAPFEQPVTLVNGHLSTLEPKLVFMRGSINLSAGAGADGAKVEVVGGDERREITALPLKLEAAPGAYEIRAKKLGFPPFETTVTLSPATPDVNVVVELGKASQGGTPRAATAPGDEAATPAPSEAANATTGAPVASAASGTGSLNITSSPPSNVVLDGRPLGKAPRVVEVPAGTHTVVFIHPKYGRQSITVKATPGQTTSASADF
ncbi:MAG TPA: PEGA domain-containing protein [Polyangiaceae bacterium]|nr:PEGA domain-containing protein [Polyangiaceae bacterium]